MRPLILDTDGSLLHEQTLAGERLDLGDLRGRLQYIADQEAVDECRRRLLAAGGPAGQCRLLGSGDFHHLTLGFIETLDRPFALIVFDNHLDCSYPFPRYACGNWLHHAGTLPLCRKIVHVGATETYGLLRKTLGLAPLLAAKKLTVIPATLPAGPTVTDLAAAIGQIAQTGLPAYVSIDKDVLPAAEAPGDWDNGITPFETLCAMVDHIRQTLDILAADITGEPSEPFAYPGHPFKRLLAAFDHPARPAPPAGDARLRHRRINAALLRALGGTAATSPTTLPRCGP